MLSTDHGHLDEGGHGGGSWQERQSFIIAGLLSGTTDAKWRPRQSRWTSHRPSWTI